MAKEKYAVGPAKVTGCIFRAAKRYPVIHAAMMAGGTASGAMGLVQSGDRKGMKSMAKRTEVHFPNGGKKIILTSGRTTCIYGKNRGLFSPTKLKKVIYRGRYGRYVWIKK